MYLLKRVLIFPLLLIMKRSISVYKTGSLEMPPTTRLLSFFFKKNMFKVYDSLKRKYVNRGKNTNAKTQQQ